MNGRPVLAVLPVEARPVSRSIVTWVTGAGRAEHFEVTPAGAILRWPPAAIPGLEAPAELLERLALETRWSRAFWAEQLAGVLRSGVLDSGRPVTEERLELFARSCARAGVRPMDVVDSVLQLRGSGF